METHLPAAILLLLVNKNHLIIMVAVVIILFFFILIFSPSNSPSLQQEARVIPFTRGFDGVGMITSRRTSGGGFG
jgi:hypothetical protein